MRGASAGPPTWFDVEEGVRRCDLHEDGGDVQWISETDGTRAEELDPANGRAACDPEDLLFDRAQTGEGLRAPTGGPRGQGEGDVLGRSKVEDCLLYTSPSPRD